MHQLCAEQWKDLPKDISDEKLQYELSIIFMAIENKAKDEAATLSDQLVQKLKDDQAARSAIIEEINKNRGTIST